MEMKFPFHLKKIDKNNKLQKNNKNLKNTEKANFKKI